MNRKLALSICLVLKALCVCANTAVVNGITWTYTVSSGTASLGSGSSSSLAVPRNTSGNITIPSTLGGYPVTSIGRYAFYGCSGLTGVVIPNSVVSIGYQAFRDCSSLVSVTIPDSVTSIGEEAFSGCSGLTSVTIPNSVTSVGYSVFYGCSGLTNVTIGSGLTYIELQMFRKCRSLMSVTIPDSVTRIADYAFAECSGLTSVVIPDSVTSIGFYVFAASGLTSVTIPAGVTSITKEMFRGCSRLTSITIPDSVTSIGNSAFSGCSSLTNVIIPAGVTSIGEWAFNKCIRLTSVTIPDSVTSFGNYMFRECSGLMSVTIGGGVTSLGHTTFYQCVNLTNVTIGSSVTSIGSSAFSGCNGLTSVTIPSSVTSVGSSAFSGCSGLTSVTIPSSVTSIGETSFRDCSGLTSVTIPPFVTSIGDNAFGNCSGLMSVYLSRDFSGSISKIGVAESKIIRYKPNQVVSFNLAGGTGVYSPIEVTYAAPYGMLPVPLRTGYTFRGWKLGDVFIDSETFVTALDDHTLVAQWQYMVMFNANGGCGSMATQIVLAGDDSPLMDNGFTRKGYQFLGWAKSKDGDVVFADGVSVSNVVGDTILYAVWGPHAPDVSPIDNLTFLNTSQKVSFSCEADDVTILYTIDGSDPTMYGLEYKGDFPVYETCTIRAIARGAGHDSDEVSITLTRAEGLSEAANLYGYLMETDGTHPWTVVTDVSHDGVSCVRSGAIGNGGTTWLQTSLKKAGTVSFWWRAACEEPDVEDGEDGYYDYGAFLVDGNVAARLAGNDTGWQFFSTNITSGGKHVLRWEYSKDGATTYAPDCVWLDQVQWIPADGSGYTLTTPEPVPYAWLSGYGLGGVSDFETAAKGATGKRGGDGRALQVWQDYVAGTDPTNAASVFTAGIEFVDGVPQVIWSPNLNTNGVVRSYTIWGKESLTDAAWHSPTNAADRFFKVSVEMP